MAKNFKLKVKNTQLAQALKLGQLKKTDENSSKIISSDKQSTSKEHTTQDQSVAKKVTQIKKSDEAQAEIKKHARIISSIKKEEIKDPVKKPPEIKEPEKPEIKKAVEEASKIATTEVTSKIEPTTQTPTTVKDTPSSTPLKPVAPKPKHPTFAPTPAKKPHAAKPTNRYETPRSFDSRDRLGLRSNEERSWRRRKSLKSKSTQKKEIETIKPSELRVRLPISLKDLAAAMKIKATQILAKLFKQGVVITINDSLEEDTIVQLIGHDFNCEIIIDTSEEERLRITNQTIPEELASQDPDKLTPRSPVITFMGHVDHGKTSLIDNIRNSQIAHGESGAITQHIGAFKCHQKKGDITILDTPGHEDFALMRTRGVNIADLLILVIAGDEGIKQQTEEVITKAKAAEVPVVIAINKCDKPDFDADNVYRQLADHELLPESWGGNVITVNCSAVTGEGIEQLLEMILLQSEILELKANNEMRARGTVIESERHKGQGSIATVLVQNGTLKCGDSIVLDTIYGRVKTMYDEHNQLLTKAIPSTPVKITGLSGLPMAGSEFIVVSSEKEAKKLGIERALGQKRELLQQTKPEGIEALMKRHSEQASKKTLNLIIRADVKGSLEALKNSLLNIHTDKIKINCIALGVGEISESDVELASISNAPIIGFHTSIENRAEPLLRHFNVQLIKHDVIYHIIHDLKQIMIDKLDKIREENEVGTATIQMVFKASSFGVIAGCIVNDGVIKKNHITKLFRGNKLLWEGNITSLKRIKDDAKEVKSGLECGILLKNYNDIQEGDLIKSYDVTYSIQEL